MPMIGGEAAEDALLERRSVAEDGRDPYGLGWVVDWMYGDAALPPTPLPRDPEPVSPWHRPAGPHAPDMAPAPWRDAPRKRHRARQLALL